MRETVTIIDYGSGNLRSAAKAFERAAASLDNPPEIIVTDDPQKVRHAARIVLPGVGAFAGCRAGLRAVSGMDGVLEERVIGAGVPFLGICVGMQLMASAGLEKGTHSGFGWIAGQVVRLAPNDTALKVPHMGWNTLDIVNDHPVLAGLPGGEDGGHAYFVHSYHLVPADPKTVLATAGYSGPITAMAGRDNMIGTQFHPEKSQKLGLILIGNFLRWRP